VEILHLVFTRYCPRNIPQLNWSANCLQDNSSARTHKTQSLCCCRCLFTAPLHSNCRGVNHIENIVLLFLNTCCGPYLTTSLITRLLLNNGSMCHIAPSLRLFALNSLQAIVIYSFPRPVLVTSVIGLSFLPWLGLHCVYFPTAPAALF
jgi:hypothetical protein